MIGLRIEKPLKNYDKYTSVATWCNENNAMIVARDNYYEVVEVPPYVPSQADKKGELTRKLNTIKSAYQGAVLMGNDTVKLQEEYKRVADELAKLEEGDPIGD